jgi:hypothetical protein
MIHGSMEKMCGFGDPTVSRTPGFWPSRTRHALAAQALSTYPMAKGSSFGASMHNEHMSHQI